MNPNIEFTQTAEQDVQDTVERLYNYSPRSASRFIRSLEQLLDLLVAFPLLGTIYDEDNPEFDGIRYSTIKRFRTFVVYYRPLKIGIRVIRVLHGGRNAPAHLTGDG